MSKLETFISIAKTINLFELIKRFYGNLIDLIGFIVDKTSEQGADIAIRALPIVSPLPNAISMYYVSQTVLKFTDLQAKAFAIAMELALFGLFEVVLNQFDGWQRDPKRYTITLRLASAIAVGVMVLIIIVVWRVETDRPILATLPLFSAAGAAALTLRRWHNHNEVDERVRADDWRVRFELENHSRTQAEQTVFALSTQLGEWERSNGFLTTQVDSLTRQIEQMEGLIKSASIGVSEPVRTSQTESVGSDKRRFDFLRMLAETTKKSEVNFTEVARQFGTSDTTMRKDLDWLIKNEYWLNGNDWKLTTKGLTVIGEPLAN